jgi:hypothetical protein
MTGSLLVAAALILAFRANGMIAFVRWLECVLASIHDRIEECLAIPPPYSKQSWRFGVQSKMHCLADES